MENEFTIQDIKETILYKINAHYKVIGDDSDSLVMTAMEALEGFSKNVCETVFKYGRASEKQAYCIARGIVEQFSSLEEMEEVAKNKRAVA